MAKASLKKEFPPIMFHDEIDANFNTDSELIGYDDFHKMYKVNQVLESIAK